MKITVYNQEGKEIGQTIIPKEIFDIPINSDLVHQVVISQMAIRRKVIAHTKTRAEVRGGGRKPWRQKGTGRARAGSIRSPIWRGGGVTFGPTTEKVFKKRIPKKMRRKALFMVLSAKAKESLLLVLDNLKIEKPKTKSIAEILNKLFLKKGSGLVVLPRMDKNIIKATKNIPRVSTVQAKDLNVLDLLCYKYIMIPKEAIKVIKETFLTS
ncbi:MAG: 50S ribosomal protein L4 [Candidatus Pacebacteria bacterium]|nr:50S ribosomal protein L4 [Candidatus Paceibacterota bacterium]